MVLTDAVGILELHSRPCRRGCRVGQKLFYSAPFSGWENLRHDPVRLRTPLAVQGRRCQHLDIKSSVARSERPVAVRHRIPDPSYG
jgi:hypothetical protein